MSTALAFLFLSCTTEQTGTPPAQTSTPQPTATALPSPMGTMSQTETSSTSPIPFNRYGEMLANVTYCNLDNSPQQMDLYFPDAGGPWPVLVYVHGGGWMHGDKSEAAMFARGMTAQGYLVVSVNYRLYPPSIFPAMIQDVKCAIRSLRANAAYYNLDPTRIGAMGVSAGGHLVGLLGTADPNPGWDVGEYLDQPSRVQAVIAMAGVMDLSREFPNADIETMKQVGFGEYNVEEASPISHVTPDDPPFLLIHGEQDELVPVEQSQLMYDRLLQANVPAQLVVVTNAGHSMTSRGGTARPTLAEINQIITSFLSQHLKQP